MQQAAVSRFMQRSLERAMIVFVNSFISARLALRKRVHKTVIRSTIIESGCAPISRP
jgi:hypothetical protein